jgi:endo-1,4-beta-xylanase
MGFWNGLQGSKPAKRFVLAAAVSIALFGCSSPAVTPSAVPSAAASSAPSIAPTPTSAPVFLKDLAGTRYFGTAVNGQLLGSDADYTKILNSQFSQVTPENAMKWGPLEPQRGTFNWADADALVASAQANGQKVRGHTLVWHSQLPTWHHRRQLRPRRSSNDIREAAHRDRSRALQGQDLRLGCGQRGVQRGRHDAPIHLGDDPGRRATSPTPSVGRTPPTRPPSSTSTTTTPMDINPKSDGLYALVKKLKADGVPIDGVGFQAHLDTTVTVSRRRWPRTCSGLPPSASRWP